MKLLILGGTKDAVDLAEGAAGLPGVQVIYSLAGVTQNPNLPNCGVRQGGFGGAAGLQDYLNAETFDAVIDATHPYAAQIARNASEACAAVNLPRLKFLRPPWTSQIGEKWEAVADIPAAVAALAGEEKRVFLTIGVKELATFEQAAGVPFLVRYIHPPKDGGSLTNAEVIVDRGPYTVDGERELMAKHDVGVLVSKNSGGDGASAKLIAARELGVRVIMVDRPALPAGEVIGRQSDALTWIRELN